MSYFHNPTSQFKKHRRLRFGLLAGLCLAISSLAFWQAVPAGQISHRPVANPTKNLRLTAIGSSSKPTLSQSGALQAAARAEISATSAKLPLEATATAAVISWSQHGDSGVELTLRTKRADNSWTAWVTAESDDQKDGAPNNHHHSALVIGNQITSIQYRFRLHGEADQPSAQLDLSKTKLLAIDTSDGPEQATKPLSILRRHFRPQLATAQAEGPTVISREAWGSPQIDSPDWPPEYHILGRAVIHHTVTTETPNSYAAVRAIWDYHTNTRGWGDIGYSFLVDGSGTIFQGRYYDKDYAYQNGVEVEAGHTLQHNDGTIGIAAIGNYQEGSPSQATLQSMADIIAYRFAPYGLNPSDNGPFNGPTITGHREHNSTACPGEQLYQQLPTIRALASTKTGSYRDQYQMDYSYVSQSLYKNGQAAPRDAVFQPGDDAEISFDLKNTGKETWSSVGANSLQLGTSREFDRASRFSTPSWTSPNRPGSFIGKLVDGQLVTSETIAPDEIARFRFPINIPELAGPVGGQQLFKEYFQPVIDGRMWLRRDSGIFQPLSVRTNSYVWQWQSQALYTDQTKTATSNPEQLQPNRQYFAVLSLKNTGTATWRATSLRLGTNQPADRSSSFFEPRWLSSNRAGKLDQNSVASGQAGTISFWIKTPGAPFDKREYFRPVADGIGWLNDLGLYWRLRSQ